MFAFCPDLLMEVLPIMGMGIVDVFIVSGIMISAVALINKLADLLQQD